MQIPRPTTAQKKLERPDGQSNRYTFRLEFSQDDKTRRPFMEGKYEKQP